MVEEIYRRRPVCFLDHLFLATLQIWGEEAAHVLPFSQDASNIDLGVVGVVWLEELNVLELLAEGFTLGRREDVSPFHNPPLGFSLREA
jgi:hypothetical protein